MDSLLTVAINSSEFITEKAPPKWGYSRLGGLGTQDYFADWAD
jgi:hypothetical protein